MKGFQRHLMKWLDCLPDHNKFEKFLIENFTLADSNLLTKMVFGMLFWMLCRLFHVKKCNNSQNQWMYGF